MASLPYIEALTLELQRWRTAAPQAVPHRLMEDDTYKDQYHIPAGALVFGNTYGISRDPSLFPNPEECRPSRYMPGEERDSIMRVLGKGHTGFGHGRRVCPGIHMAERSMFITLAYIFWAFDVLPVPGAAKPDP